MSTAPAPGMRVDKWLWHARFFKSRSRAAEVVSGGHLRISGTRAAKASHTVRVGDVLVFAQGREIRVIKVLSMSERRGPAPEARALYEDLTPERPKDPSAPKAVQGKVDRRDRRAARLSKQSTLE